MKKCVCVCVWSFCLLFPDISVAQIRSNLLSSVSKRNSSNSDFEMKKNLEYDPELNFHCFSYALCQFKF